MSSKRRQNTQHSTSLFPDEQEQEMEKETAFEPEDVEPSPEPKPVARQATSEGDRIGDILRRVRKHRGEDLMSISDYLRIRPDYLFALEKSRYEELPADAYVIGFLRSYATYLGLDGRGAIDQYRREMAGRRRKPQLSMPQPMTEGRAPTITVLIAAALAALLVYGIWYGLSSPDKEAIDKPIPLPQTTQEGESTSSNDNTAASTNTAPETGLPTQTATSDGISLSVPVTAVSTTTSAASSATTASSPAPAKPSAAETAATPEPSTATTSEPPKEEPAVKDKEKNKDKEKEKDAKEQKPTKETKPANDVSPSPAPVTPAAPAVAPAASPQTSAKEKPVATPSTETGKGHVVIKAQKESWVLVTDSKGNTVFDRTLKVGETYSVPTGKGLKLTTGNPKGVSFTLDGNELPKLSNKDEVVRAVPLDPEKLKNRLTTGVDAPDSEE